MQAATVELLTRKAQFSGDQALAVAEAIDMAIADQQLVTVPILDARFEAQQTRMDARFADVDARFAAMGAKMDARFAALEARFDRFRLQIIIAILIGHVALGPVGVAIVKAIGHAF
jgi:hypothetical protein